LFTGGKLETEKGDRERRQRKETEIGDRDRVENTGIRSQNLGFRRRSGCQSERCCGLVDSVQKKVISKEVDREKR
jgi:hypothetical protein